jgi:hypothetical protein
MTTAHRPTFDPVGFFSFPPHIRKLTNHRLAERKPSADRHTTNVSSQRILPSNIGKCQPSRKKQDEILTSHRKEGQGGDAENQVRDLRAELLRAEAAHFAKKSGKTIDDSEESPSEAPKRTIEDAKADADEDEIEHPEAKRRRLILEEARDLDADSDGSSEETSDEE